MPLREVEHISPRFPARTSDRTRALMPVNAGKKGFFGTIGGPAGGLPTAGRVQPELEWAEV
jgi:hypothetical protein